MGRSNKGFSLLLVVILAVSSLIMVESASAQSIRKPPVPEFTIETVSHPYDVPPSITTATDPYTGKQTTTTQPGYHVENKTLEAVIKNSLGTSYYNFRYKGHYAQEWSYFPFDPNSSNGYNFYDAGEVPNPASSSDYTVITLSFLPQSATAGGQIDIQVQALSGNYDAIPYGHMINVGGPTYDFIFKGAISDWSNTQTITIGETSNTTSPTPAVSEFPILVILPFFISVLLVAVYLKHRRINHE
jgi:hypothetical protein